MSSDDQKISFEKEKLNELLEKYLRLKEENLIIKADIKKLVGTFYGILHVLDLKKGLDKNTIWMKIPGIISKINRHPEIFNFLDKDILQIINKYAEGYEIYLPDGSGNQKDQ